MSYITEGDLENHILQDIDASFSTWIASVISMVEAFIETYTGVDFEGNSAATDRYFDGNGESQIIIDTFQSGTSAVYILDESGDVLHTLTRDSDYWEYPLNETIKNQIVLSGSGIVGSFLSGARRVKVSAKFGFDTIPKDVKLAAVRMAAQIINEGLKGGQVSAETLGSYSVSYAKVDEVADAIGIKGILNMHRQMSL